MRRTLLFFSMALLLSWGCHKRSSVTVPATPPVVSPLPSKQPAPANLELGEKNFKLGNYRQAAKYIELFLTNNPKSPQRDQALFHLGLSHALANDSSRDLQRSESAFKRLIAEFPDSPYKSEAEYILGLQAQIERFRLDVKERDDRIKKLSEELKVLKEIDLQRKPSQIPH